MSIVALYSLAQTHLFNAFGLRLNLRSKLLSGLAGIGARNAGRYLLFSP